MAVNLLPGWRPGLAGTGLISASFTFATLAYQTIYPPTIAPLAAAPPSPIAAHIELPLWTLQERDYCFPLNGTTHGCVVGYSQCEAPDHFFDSSNTNAPNASYFVYLFILFLELLIISTLFASHVGRQSRKYRAIERHHMVAALKHSWIWNFFSGIKVVYGVRSTIHSLCDTVGASLHGPSSWTAFLIWTAFAIMIAAYWTADAACERSRLELMQMEAQRNDETKDSDLEIAHKATAALKQELNSQQQIVSRMLAANDKLEGLNSKLNGELQSSSAAVGHGDVTIKQLRDELSTNKADNEVLNTNLKVKSGEVDALILKDEAKSDDIARYAKAQKEVLEKLNTAWGENEKLERQIKGLERQKAELDTKVQTSNDEQETLKVKVRELERQIDDLGTKLQASGEECASAKQATDCAQAEVAKKVALIEELSEDYTAVQTNLKEQESIVEDLQGELKAEQDNVCKLEVIKDTLTGELKAEQNNVRKLKASEDTLTSELKAEQDNMRKLRASKETVTRELESLKVDVASLKQPIKSQPVKDEDKSNIIGNFLAQKTATHTEEQQGLQQMSSFDEDFHIKLAQREADTPMALALGSTQNYQTAAHTSDILPLVGPVSPSSPCRSVEPKSRRPDASTIPLHTVLPQASPPPPSAPAPTGDLTLSRPSEATSFVNTTDRAGSDCSLALSESSFPIVDKERDEATSPSSTATTSESNKTFSSSPVDKDRDETTSLASTAASSESDEKCSSSLVDVEREEDTPSTVSSAAQDETFESRTSSTSSSSRTEGAKNEPSKCCWYRPEYLCRNWTQGNCIGNPADWDSNGYFKIRLEGDPPRYGGVGDEEKAFKRKAAGGGKNKNNHGWKLCNKCFMRRHAQEELKKRGSSADWRTFWQDRGTDV